VDVADSAIVVVETEVGETVAEDDEDLVVVVRNPKRRNGSR